MNRVLFLIEQWCDGKPECGFSQPLTHYCASFVARHSRYIHWDVVPPDRLRSSVESALKELPAFCVFCDTGHPWAPPTGLLEWIAARIPLVALWHDSARDYYRNIRGAKLNVGIDGIENVPLPNYVPMWTPVDFGLFNGDPSGIRPIDLIHPGTHSTKPNALAMAEMLKARSLELRWGGGQRDSRLTWEEYARLLGSSKIVVDFPRNALGDVPQLKGRVFEAAACGAALITERNPLVVKHFEPGREVLLYSSPEECADLCERLVMDDNARIIQAINAQQKFKSHWRVDHWWRQILERIS
jgi:hypothetical protein